MRCEFLGWGGAAVFVGSFGWAMLRIEERGEAGRPNIQCAAMQEGRTFDVAKGRGKGRRGKK